MQEIYAEPIKEELVGHRIAEIKEAGVTSCASVTPQRTSQLMKAILEAELDLLVIQGTVVSAEHVSKTVEPLNLKRFVRELKSPSSSVAAPPTRAPSSSCAPVQLASSSA